MTNPISDPAAYRTARIAGQWWPGYVQIEGDGIARAWKKNKGTGSSGATTSFEGEDLGEFTMTLQAWEDAHFEAHERTFAPILQKAPEGENGAIDVFFPSLAEIGLTSIVLQNVPMMKVLDDTGLWGWAYKCLQYRAPKPAQGSPKGSKSDAAGAGAAGGAGGDVPPPDPVDDTINDLTNDFNDELAGGENPP